MAACLCSEVRQLANQYDETRVQELIPALDHHLRDLRSILNQVPSATRTMQYRITPTNQRTSKVLSVESVALTAITGVFERFKDDIAGFWAASGGIVADLRRRLSCVVIFLISRLDTEVATPPTVATLFPEHQNYQELRHAGRKYIKISRRLGGLGSLLWLPYDIPHSTYERYINMDDDETFDHLQCLSPPTANHTDFVQRLVLSQLRDPTTPSSYHNLIAEFNDVIPASDHVMMLLYAMGGSNIPDVILRSVRTTQRRWNADGEVEIISPAEFGISAELIALLSNEAEIERATTSPCITKDVLEGDVNVWSLDPRMVSFYSQALIPRATEELGATALKLISFACPPCYEGNTSFSASMKKAVWPLLEKTAKKYKIPTSQRAHVLDATLYFCERDSAVIRRLAVDQAKMLLRKPMPYYLHASVALFRSIIYRIDGNLAQSEAQIRDFLWRGPRPSTRRDYALQGRLHISQIDNKIKCYDDDVPSFIYKWEAQQPLSSLDTEVTFRLQSAAARFFQSIGDFTSARASLEQVLSLNTAKPIRANSRRLLVGRLAEIYCELEEYPKVFELVRPELDSIGIGDRPRTPFRRLLLALMEANIGLGRVDAAESVLRELEDAEPPEMETVHDQQLHMRRILAAARVYQMRHGPAEAVLRWRLVLDEVERMSILKSKLGFTAAMIYLSMAHAQLATGDRDGAWHSWSSGAQILSNEKCEFWIPIVPTIWLQRVVRDVHGSQGWPFRMMLPGGRPDFTWP